MSKKREPAVAKLFIRADSGYIFSEKNKLGSTSDHRLELIGGKIDRCDKTPVDALIREAGEEDLSGIIASEVRRQQPKGKEIVVGKQDHSIFEISISDAQLKNLPNEDESHGFVRIEAKIIDEPSELTNAQNFSRFTDKTQKIFRKLGFILKNEAM
jgi:hypothetical protein